MDTETNNTVIISPTTTEEGKSIKIKAEEGEGIKIKAEKEGETVSTDHPPPSPETDLKGESSEKAVATSETTANSNGNAGSSTTLSKRQKRKQDKLRLWEETRHLRKEKRKQKKKECQDRKRQRLEALKSEAEEKGLDPSSITDPHSRTKLKSNLMKNSSCKVAVCVDMSFNNLMIEKDVHKCIKQLSRCYSVNRRYENPLQFHISSFTGKSVEVISKNDGWKTWDIHFHEKSYLEIDEFPKDKIVYLTAESENILREPEDSKLYVIGGLVDHNSQKGLCHKLALEKGIQHARLPLDEYIEMSARKVLSIFHVFEILGRVAQKRPWTQVLMEVLPQRAQAKLKDDRSESDDEASDDNDEKDNQVNLQPSKT